MTPPLRPPHDFADLANLSARIGANPALIQAAGGNTSVKEDNVMWIKASGTLLAEAEVRNIFVPVDLAAMRAALDDPAMDADQAGQFTCGDQPLRPSIETSLHAVFEQRVVMHVHCVNTLALAVQQDAAERLAQRLAGFNWQAVPYTKPGASLAGLVRAALTPKTNVVVLANHGLIIAADSVAEADALLSRVVTALKQPTARSKPVDMAGLTALATRGWKVPSAQAPVHQLALDDARLRQATGGSLYPDHVIFCGVGATAIEGALPAPSAMPPFVLIPGKGAMVRADASSSSIVLMNCLGDVLLRVPAGARLTYLTPDQNAELLNWDAEHYRQALNA